jgi:hypothetical protein
MTHNRVHTINVGYLMTLSVSTLYSVNDGIIDECKTVTGMRIFMVNEITL